MSTGVGVEFTTDTRRARKVFDSATALARQSGPVLAAGPSSPGKLWSVWFQDDGDIIFGCQFGSLPVDARSDYCREHRQVDGLSKYVGTVRCPGDVVIADSDGEFRGHVGCRSIGSASASENEVDAQQVVGLCFRFLPTQERRLSRFQVPACVGTTASACYDSPRFLPVIMR